MELLDGVKGDDFGLIFLGVVGLGLVEDFLVDGLEEKVLWGSRGFYLVEVVDLFLLIENDA